MILISAGASVVGSVCICVCVVLSIIRDAIVYTCRC